MLEGEQDRLEEKVLDKDVPKEDVSKKYNNQPRGGQGWRRPWRQSGWRWSCGETGKLADLDESATLVDPEKTRLEVAPRATRMLADPEVNRLELSPGLTRILADPEATILATGFRLAMEAIGVPVVAIGPEAMKFGSPMEK